jgi:ketosteroid isomerase-like protein
MSTPAQVFEKLSEGIGSGDWSQLHLLYAEDASVEIPFMMPGPVRIHGREQVRTHFARMAGRISLRPRDVRVYETADPTLIVAEWNYEANGVTLPNIQVLRVRDGLIVQTRDYHHHAAIAELLG